jgi:hypothetical protein
MTFSVLVVKNDQPRVVGTLWADDEARARDLAPVMCTCGEGEQVKLLRTETREIPLHLATPVPMRFC